MNKMRASVAVVVRPVLLAIAAGGVLLTFAASGASRAGASEGNRQPGEKRDIVVRLRERQVLFVAPDNDGTRQWGVYGCPLMHRAADGSIVVYDGGHGDTYDAEAGAKAPAVAFRSRDNGLTWEPLKDELPADYRFSNQWFPLAGGAGCSSSRRGRQPTCALGVAPRGMVVSANEYGLLGLYCVADLPPAARTFQVRYQPAGADAPEVADAVLDIPDWQIGATLKAKTGAATWPDVTPTFTPVEGDMGLDVFVRKAGRGA